MVNRKLKSLYALVARYDLEFCIFIGVASLLLFITRIGCPTRYLTGICCPGCGMTRAVLHLLMLDFRGAIYYHPLVFVLPVLALLYIKRNNMNRILLNSLLFFIIILFLVVYVLRLFDVNNQVVYIDLQQGLIYKIIVKVLSI